MLKVKLAHYGVQSGSKQKMQVQYYSILYTCFIVCVTSVDRDHLGQKYPNESKRVQCRF
jgi:hypothetical protein